MTSSLLYYDAFVSNAPPVSETIIVYSKMLNSNDRIIQMPRQHKCQSNATPKLLSSIPWLSASAKANARMCNTDVI